MNEEIIYDDITRIEIATLGSGCFWCTEAIFESVMGVIEVVCGYSGGITDNPTYQSVLTGETMHAECVQIKFDKTIISYDEILEIFWKTHDPTTPNRQGNDIGTQYRSIIFYHNQEQKQKAEHFKKLLEDNNIWNKPIVTEIVPFKKFYKAENYHQDYYRLNPNQSYCYYVINPKLEKFKETFKNKLKKN